jgi:hypothetical protein
MVMGWDLYSTLQVQAEYAGFYRSIPPMACPFDGTPLLLGPPQEPATLYCPFGNYYYPRDYDPERDQGM